jgi:hypothetical protein
LSQNEQIANKWKSYDVDIQISFQYIHVLCKY